MGVSRVYAETPFFLWQKKPSYISRKSLTLLFITAEGTGTPLFNKGRDCLAYVLSLYKELDQTRDEVVIPAYNAQSLVFATIFNHLKVKLIDIDQRTFFPAFDAYKQAITNKTLAVIFPYNWGIFPALDEIKEIHQLCRDKKVLWIDDFATSVPSSAYAEYFNQNSPCVFFSFGKTKILTLMDGGYAYFPKSNPVHECIKERVAGDNKVVSDNTFSIRDVQRTISNIAYRSYTSRLGFFFFSRLGLTAQERPPQSMHIDTTPLSHGWEEALNDIISRYYDKSYAARKKIFEAYHRIFGKKFDNLFFLFPSTKEHVGSRFPLLFKNKELRDKAYARLNKKAIGASLGHICWLKENPLLQTYLKDSFDKNFPEAISFQDRLLTIPAHSRMFERDVEYIAKLLKGL